MVRPLLPGLAPTLLLGSWPFIAFLAANQGQPFRQQDVFAAWVVAVAVACGAGWIITVVFRRVSYGRVGTLVGALFVIFFSFDGISYLLGSVGVRFGTIWLLVWLGVFLGGGWLVWNVSRFPLVRRAMLAAAATMVAIPAVSLGFGFLSASGAVVPGGSEIDSEQNTGRPPGAAPNIYWLLLDGYVRGDSLARYFGYDNEPFLGALESRGFDVARSAYSNYDNTTNSLGSTLTMDYMYVPGRERPDAREYTRILSGFNSVVRTFQGLGYQYLHAPYAGSAKTQCSGIEDRCIRAGRTDRTPLSDVQVNLLQLTPVHRLIRRFLPTAFTYDHLFLADLAADLEIPSGKPSFLFAHILSPHAPPRYTEDCSRLGGVASSIDVAEGVYDPGQFRTDTRCLNESVIAAVDQILRSDTGGPIIIIQGDHGFGFRLPGEEGEGLNEETDRPTQERRLAILNAMRLPERCRQDFYSELSPVNTFRLVFACLESRAPDLLPDRHFLRVRNGDGQLVEMQERD